MPIEPRPVPVDPGSLCTLIEAVFETGGDFLFRPTGVSMRPMLRERGDAVLLRSPARRAPGVGDVVLYRRASGQVVLHRIVARHGDAFDLCGDGQTSVEHDVAAQSVVGVVVAFYRGARRVSVSSPLYRLYVRLLAVKRRAGALKNHFKQKQKR